MSVTPYDDLNQSNSNLGSKVKTNAPSLDALVGSYEAKGWRVSGINQESVSLTRDSIVSKSDEAVFTLDTQVEIAKVVRFGRIFRRVIYCLTFIIFLTLLVDVYAVEPHYNYKAISWSKVIVTLVAPCGLLVTVLQSWIQIWKHNRFRIMDLESMLETQNLEGIEKNHESKVVLINKQQANLESEASHSPIVYCTALLFFAAMLTGALLFAYSATLTPPWITIVSSLIAPLCLLVTTFKIFGEIWLRNRKRIRELEIITNPSRSSSDLREGNVVKDGIASAHDELARLERASGMPPEANSPFGITNPNDSGGQNLSQGGRKL